jgi:hypothetical protein
MSARAGERTGIDARARASGVLVATLAVGALFGVASSAANHAPAWNALAKVIGVGWSWAALGILAAAVVRRGRTRTVMAVLVAAVVGYYVADLLAGTYDVIDFSSPLAETDPMDAPVVVSWSGAVADALYWTVFAIIVSWPLARIGAALHRPDARGLAARLVIPAGAAVEMLTLRLPGELAVQPDVVTVGTYVTVAAVGLASVLVLTARHVLRVRARPDAAAAPG